MVGISGGVDSAVAAYLLKQQGYRIEGVFMQNWQEVAENPDCQAELDLTDARAACDRLAIPLRVVSFARQYHDLVFKYFLDEYAAGRTPNPDILCNNEIKFKAFLTYALDNGAEAIATGHYANIRKTNDLYQLLKAQDTTKDQSYFLHSLTQYQLAHAYFPLSNIKKATVRKIAKEIGLANYNKKDSTGICFIGERPFKSFLSEYLLAQPGDIYTTDGEYIGRHDGLMFYTLGQRKGIGIGGRKHNQQTQALYVVDKDTKHNKLIVAQGENHPRLYANELLCLKPHWISGQAPSSPYTCKAKIRYRQTEQTCTFTIDHLPRKENKDILSHHIRFREPQRAITPGQFIVFYDGDICLGGGTIALT